MRQARDTLYCTAVLRRHRYTCVRVCMSKPRIISRTCRKMFTLDVYLSWHFVSNVTTSSQFAYRDGVETFQIASAETQLVELDRSLCCTTVKHQFACRDASAISPICCSLRDGFARKDTKDDSAWILTARFSMIKRSILIARCTSQTYRT